MEIKLENVGTNQVELQIEVDNDKFDKAMEKAYNKNKSRFVIPGFRKGKAPRKVVERYYGEGVLYEDAVDFVCPEAYKEAIEEKELDVVSQPELDIVQIGNGKNLIFSAKVYTKPEVEVKDYFGVEAEEAKFPVTDEQIDQELATEQESNARMITVEDRAIENDDIAVIDYEGFVDDEPFEGGKGENHELTIGSGQFIPGFEEQLIGKNANEECDVNVTFPEEYHAENLKGKEAIFKVKIHEIKKKELPELDDEFAKDVSEFDTLAEYKDSIKAKLEGEAQEREKRENENRVLNKIVDSVEVEIPEPMIESRIDSRMREFDMQLRYQGMSLEQYAQMLQMDVSQMRGQFKDQAKADVKTQLVIEKIAKLENVEATDEEFDAEIEKYAATYNQKPEEMKKTLRDEDVESIKTEIRSRKTVELLASKAVMVEEKPKTDEEAKEEEEA